MIIRYVAALIRSIEYLICSIEILYFNTIFHELYNSAMCPPHSTIENGDMVLCTQYFPSFLPHTHINNKQSPKKNDYSIPTSKLHSHSIKISGSLDHLLQLLQCHTCLTQLGKELYALDLFFTSCVVSIFAFVCSIRSMRESSALDA